MRNETFYEWVKRFQAQIELQITHGSWIKNASNFNSHKLTDLGERVAEWIKKNPAPPNPHLKLKIPIPEPPIYVPKVLGLGNRNKQIEEARMANQLMENARWAERFRKGRQGSSSLGAILALGTMTGAAGILLKIGAFALKWYIEDKIFEAFERNIISPVTDSIGYAMMPQTKAQLHCEYLKYCDAKFTNYSFTKCGIYPQIESEEEYCWNTHGINMSVLR